MLIAVPLQGIGAIFTAGDNVDVRTGQQMFHDGLEIVFCQLTVKDIFPFTDHPSAVFGDK